MPYDAGKHPNPIVTWVNEKDFKSVPFSEAAEKVGVELMSLSRDQGQRSSVEIASPPTARQKVRIVGQEYECTFYPVMRQIYKLKSGNTFTLYTFRFPRALTTADFLNQAAFARPPRGYTPRFGSLPLPDKWIFETLRASTSMMGSVGLFIGSNWVRDTPLQRTHQRMNCSRFWKTSL